MTALPTGTVTFLFTDIEGSTRLLHKLGAERYAEALGEHRRLLREAFARHGGVEIDTQGDAFFVAFARASAAVAAAADAQHALAHGPVFVRMGIHTGEPTITGDGYVGIDVHRGARIAAAGYGGQVLVSQATRELVDSPLGLRDLGEHRLKDLSVPQRLWQLGRGEFPPLRTLHRTNLPVQATALIGRERELREAGGLLREHRLVTLTGPGGSGKTRLALQLAAEAVESFPDGVWWVSLAALRDPELVLPMVAQALGAQGELAAHLEQKRLLVLLDNLEHVIECAPELADVVATTEVKLLVTSREPLRIDGEFEYGVEPLAEAEALALFRERAAVAEPQEAVLEICRRLDCLPLAVELAAARTKLLPPAKLLARLEQRLPLLTGGRRDAPERQRTLRATIEWSYELLSAEEQRLFRRLAVFAGSFDVETAEAVCDADLDTLHSLLDKSLVRRGEDDRFSMLETVREYALQQLEERQEASEARRRYGRHLLERAGSLADDPWGDEEELWDWLQGEHDSIRSLLDWAADDDPQLELRLALSCWSFWRSHGHWSEGRSRIEQALQRNPAANDVLRASALVYIANFCWRQGDDVVGKSLLEEAIALFRSMGDTPGLTYAHALRSLAICEMHLGDKAAATRHFDEVEALARSARDHHLLGAILNNRANDALDERDLDRARAFSEEALALSRQIADRFGVANNLTDLGFLALAEGRWIDAETSFRECLSIANELNLRELAAWAIEGLAAVEIERGAAQRAATLLGSVSVLQEEMSASGSYYSIGLESRERTTASAREQLGEATFEETWAHGRTFAYEDAVEYALGWQPGDRLE